jgi:hypothetical protein
MTTFSLHLHRAFLPAGLRIRPSFSELSAPYEDKTEILVIHLPAAARVDGEFLHLAFEVFTPRTVLESLESGRFRVISASSISSRSLPLALG